LRPLGEILPRAFGGGSSRSRFGPPEFALGTGFERTTFNQWIGPSALRRNVDVDPVIPPVNRRRVVAEGFLLLGRQGERKKLDVRIGKTASEPEAVRAGAGSPAGGLGLTLGDLTPSTRERFGIPEEVQGAVVVGVDPASGAADKGLQPGDVIVSVGQKKVASLAEAKREIERQKAAERGSVLLRVVRGGDATFVAVPFA